MMLRVEIDSDGAVHITARLVELLDLAGWTILAARNGACAPTYVSDRALTRLEIVCDDD